mmetsp:Transcript_31487/g.50653  ORF Transcript_31487/g.50653 Transcript_31487/m.50653 type:complete len:214 (-) Transcript_31487:133-774(-)
MAMALSSKREMLLIGFVRSSSTLQIPLDLIGAIKHFFVSDEWSSDATDKCLMITGEANETIARGNREQHEYRLRSKYLIGQCTHREFGFGTEVIQMNKSERHGWKLKVSSFGKKSTRPRGAIIKRHRICCGIGICGRNQQQVLQRVVVYFSSHAGDLWDGDVVTLTADAHAMQIYVNDQQDSAYTKSTAGLAEYKLFVHFKDQRKKIQILQHW